MKISDRVLPVRRSTREESSLPFLCFVCSFGAVTSLSEDREMGKAEDGWSTSCSMSVIKSGGNQGKAMSIYFFQRADIESSGFFVKTYSVTSDSKALEEVDSHTLSHGAVTSSKKPTHFAYARKRSGLLACLARYHLSPLFKAEKNEWIKDSSSPFTTEICS